MSEKINDDLKYIKKHYGEKFAHLCRELFPTILENEGLLSKIIASEFAPSRSLFDAFNNQKEEFQAYIFQLAGIEILPVVKTKTNKSPKELFDEAGYILYDECKTEEEIQAFKKFYAPDEAICTFEGDRLETCRVWFAVKKNVNKIKRKNFWDPQRQDEYGTSVISIQFTKGNYSTLSIKNRYNHSVKNPDATFSNNLDNIIEGLTDAFVREFGIEFSEDDRPINLDDFCKSINGKNYFISLRTIDVNFCENNVVLNGGEVTQLDKSRYILMENYVVDLKKNQVMSYKKWLSQKDKELDEDKDDFRDKMRGEITEGKSNDDNCDLYDSFIKSLGKIRKIDVSHDSSGNKIVVVIPEEGENVEITLGAHNEMIGYKNHNVEEIDDDFLPYNKSLRYLDMPIVHSIGNKFLAKNKSLTSIFLPNVEFVGNYFINANEAISEVDMQRLKQVGNSFLSWNRRIRHLELPSLCEIGNEFLESNVDILSLILPKVTKVGHNFLTSNLSLESLYMPNLISTGNYFLDENRALKTLDFSALKKIGAFFFDKNRAIQTINLSSLNEHDYGYLSWYCQNILIAMENVAERESD